jgi:hypothetical protein
MRLFFMFFEEQSMKQISIILLSIAVLLGACSPTPASTVEPKVDIDATVSVLSKTAVADILTKQPTITPLPSETVTVTPPPAALSSPTITVMPTETATSIPLDGSFAPGGLKGAKNTALFRIENNTGQTLHVFFNGVTKPGGKPIYYEYEVKYSFNFTIAWGNYDYTVQIGTKKTITGKFGIGNDDKTTMRVFSTKVVVVGP